MRGVALKLSQEYEKLFLIFISKPAFCSCTRILISVTGIRMKPFIIISSFLHIFAFCVSSSVVRVEHGDISGTTYQLPSGRTVHAFYGVPYAAPPTHKFRFRVNILLNNYFLNFNILNARILWRMCIYFELFRNHKWWSHGLVLGMPLQFHLHACSTFILRIRLLVKKIAYMWTFLLQKYATCFCS